MKRRRVLAAGASTLAAAFAGCTGTDDGGGGGGGDGEDTTTPTSDDDAGGGAYGGGGDDGTTETATATETETATTAADTTTTNGGTEDATVVTVGADGQTRFTPEEVTVATGETVRWEWASSGHNVRPDSQPADADWTGTPGGENETYDSDYVYEFTFEVGGRYEYYCAPHQSFGMVGTVVVEK
ncbi:plastocyanin/azurin family copper-binding protein [Halobacterium rubrum]|uniref:plastocyanin/azurin family copper-binding protein n=1 Tax=Halobacterium TaxID=2239 RepID=UPI001F0190B0|nr:MULTISPECIES: plastocyanin/azurin family copper-binding protein [Halobacterium]MDH5019226.1 plastocyanin/azurin family copper-binding protein [Halobacterium rubrum]